MFKSDVSLPSLTGHHTEQWVWLWGFSLQHHVSPLGKGLYFVQWDTCQAGNSVLYWDIHVKCHQIKTGRKIFPRTVSCMHLVTRKVEVKSLSAIQQYTAEKSWEQFLFRYVVILPSWAKFQVSSVSQSLLQLI